MTESAAAPHLPEFGIFLVAHTNVGKTTLIRTLLGKDVGEIEDAPDVTKAVTSYDLVVDRTAGALRLWDTRGSATASAWPDGSGSDIAGSPGRFESVGTAPSTRNCGAVSALSLIFGHGRA